MVSQSLPIRVQSSAIREFEEEFHLTTLFQLFRHGDRTVDKKALYPTDPYLNYTYYPFGHGELTRVSPVNDSS